MDAVEFLKTLRRMCNCECLNCEFKKRLSGFESCTVWRKTPPEEAVAIAEKWAAAHPVKTRQSVFLEQWPEAFYSAGLLQICPACVSRSFRGRVDECVVEPKNCQKCKKDFWLAEVEE